MFPAAFMERLRLSREKYLSDEQNRLDVLKTRIQIAVDKKKLSCAESVESYYAREGELPDITSLCSQSLIHFMDDMKLGGNIDFVKEQVSKRDDVALKPNDYKTSEGIQKDYRISFTKF